MTRAVTEPSDYAPNPEMSAFGYVVAALSLLALVPLLPFLAGPWLYDRVSG